MRSDELRHHEFLPRARARALMLLLLPPVLFLLAVGLRYALVVLTCAGAGGRIAFELVAALPLAVLIALAWNAWKAQRLEVESDTGAEGSVATDRFLKVVALASCALFSIATLALWMTSLVPARCP